MKWEGYLISINSLIMKLLGLIMHYTVLHGLIDGIIRCRSNYYTHLKVDR